MPLQVFLDTPDLENIQATQVWSSGRGLRGEGRYEVGMGGYAVAHNFENATALGTGGALPCQIIVVHKARGWGALGHYAAHCDPEMIVGGIQEMVNQLRGPPIADVVLAAGMIGVFGHQLRYELFIVARVHVMCPGARVLWPKAPKDDVWGSCFYLPLAEQIGLFSDYPGDFTGTGNAENGITLHQYGKLVTQLLRRKDG